MDEFDVIDRYFKPLGNTAANIVLGIGDDAAVLNVPPGEQIVVTTDTQVEAVHFPVAADPAAIAYRSCAAALSDIAAMGATARWVSLALTLPRADADWLHGFAAGAADALEFADADLVGGDTTSGPLAITWSIIGTVPQDDALRRDGARPGDALYVSGSLGSARAALELLDLQEPASGFQQAVIARYWKPQPRLKLGSKLRGLANSCIDVSDGLLADAGHLARRSRTGVEIASDDLPLQAELIALFGAERAREFALTGGDDYELCFSVPRDEEVNLMRGTTQFDVPVTRIGRITRESGVRVIDREGKPWPTKHTGYRHFD
jgi:thiamine-monophosphate kinase